MYMLKKGRCTSKSDRDDVSQPETITDLTELNIYGLCYLIEK